MATRIGDTYYFTLDEINRGGGGGSVSWGDIDGTLADQTDLNTALTDRYTKAELQALGEEFVFTMQDNATVTKIIPVLPSQQGGA